MAGWQFWIDRGGTFTDVVARRPDGSLAVEKLLSEAPDRYADAALEGIRRLMGAGDGPLPASEIEAVKMGTTVATNALLERKGEPTLLCITRGHGDALRIGYQNRPRIFDRKIVLPEPLYAAVAEIDERVTAEGEVLRSLDRQAARIALEEAFEKGLRAVAIVLMHGYRFAAHEAEVASIARAVGFTQVSVSHEVSALIKLIARGDTTVVDAYLSPPVARYVDRLALALGPETRLLFMQSNGGLVAANRFRGRDAVLSGPAGGIVGLARTAEAAGFQRVIGFDMGGTSTDVSHYAGTFERTYDATFSGVRIRAPMLAIHTVAAGGGSICAFDGARLRVGPHSAGADPGPACYRRGGPLTITDCNVLLGRILPSAFPPVFGPGGDEPLDAEAVRTAFAALTEAVEQATGLHRTLEELAEGFLTIAVESMANAIKSISVQRGHDVADHVLACFGGAAGQHACRVADALGMTTVMLHPLAGVLSAYGMGLADLRVVREASVDRPLAADAGFSDSLAELERAAREALAAQDVPLASIEALPTARLRYEGTDAALTVPYGSPHEMKDAFEKAHQRQFGFLAPDRAVTVEALSVEVVGQPDGNDALPPPPRHAQSTSAPAATAPVWIDGAMRTTPVYARDALSPGSVFSVSRAKAGETDERAHAGSIIDGPAIVTEATGTIVVEPGWRARVAPGGELILERITPLAAARTTAAAVDPVRLELFNNLFMAIAEQMGTALQNTAYSVNIKERLDFSCALFDGEGALIANAPHIPVHLGSMGDGVKTVIANRRSGADGRGMKPGDAYMLNNPYRGGTHLPDITVIMPVFAGDIDAEPEFYVAARGHHADVGGITPGSMPPASRCIEDEGVLIDDALLVDAGRFREAETRAIFAAGPHPARNIDQNIGDLKAQVAACARGAEALLATVEQQGIYGVRAYMAHVQDNAEEAVRRAIGRLSNGAFRLEMDDGSIIAVRITVDREARSAVVDFTGTSEQRPTNLNAPFSICRAAVMYVFRTLVDDDIPLNDGCLRPITIIAPQGSMLRPQPPAAVVAGNVETSQAITEALYGALGLQAAAQGTMNNFTFGDGERQYYETICGGSGAGDGFAGAGPVQTHMTNSRITDPEVMETRYPVLIEQFSVREGSGGGGRWPGGDGAIRKLTFRAPMTASILSNRRRIAPFGLQGGGDGACGVNRVERADGSVETLTPTQTVEMRPGDAFVIETPGGGGFGNG